VTSASADTRRVPRARPALDLAHKRRIVRAQRAVSKAQDELEVAVLAALADGQSYLAIQDATGLAATTIARYVKNHT
jgi:hypothetical protein